MTYKEKFKVEGNCIVDRQGAILYDYLNDVGITKAQAKKLAKIHSDNPGIDFENAWRLVETKTR